MSNFAPATRKATHARIALAGPPGSGKTYTGLHLVTLLGDNPAVIDTEHRSASKYVGRNGWQFQTSTPSTFAPLGLVALLAEAADAGHDAVLLDSWSHYWMGSEGMLDQVDRRANNGNTFGGWKAMRPEERQMVDALLSYPGHVIVTLRVKTEYVIEENARGKKEPRRVGLKPEQRDGIEYEFDLYGDLDNDNNLSITKSRIPELAKSVIHEPGPELATAVLDWAREGEGIPDSRQLRLDALAATTVGQVVEVGVQMMRLGLDNAAVLDGARQVTTLAQLLRDRHSALSHAGAAVAPAEDGTQVGDGGPPL